MKVLILLVESGIIYTVILVSSCRRYLSCSIRRAHGLCVLGRGCCVQYDVSLSVELTVDCSIRHCHQNVPYWVLRADPRKSPLRRSIGRL